MKTARKALVFLTVVMGVAACEVFQDPTPDFLIFHMDGEPGSVATLIFSKQFVVGTTQDGFSRVEIFGTDTVLERPSGARFEPTANVAPGHHQPLVG